MSAFVCTDYHIAELVKGYSQLRRFAGRSTPADMQGMADMLKQENVRSVNARYREDDPAEPVVADWRFAARITDPVTLLKMIDCLDYQSCETDDYRETKAYRLLEQMQATFIRCLPGYDDAPWGLDEEEPSAPTAICLSALCQPAGGAVMSPRQINAAKHWYHEMFWDALDPDTIRLVRHVTNLYQLEALEEELSAGQYDAFASVLPN